MGFIQLLVVAKLLKDNDLFGENGSNIGFKLDHVKKLAYVVKLNFSTKFNELFFL